MADIGRGALFVALILLFPLINLLIIRIIRPPTLPDDPKTGRPISQLTYNYTAAGSILDRYLKHWLLLILLLVIIGLFLIALS